MPRLQKKSVTLSGHETSMALEPEFWAVLSRLAASRDCSLAQMIRFIDEARGREPLASACRVAALRWALAGQPGATPRLADPDQ